MGLRIQVADNKVVDVPPKVEAEGEAAIDAFVLKHSGVDLAVRRAESAKLLEKRRAEEAAETRRATAVSEAAAAAALEGGGLITVPSATPSHDAGGAGEEE